MKTKTKLKDILEAIDFQSDESVAYLEKSTGEVFLFTEDVLEAAYENDEELICSDYTDEEFATAKRVIKSPDNFLELPSQFDMNEYRIMEKFCYSITDKEVEERALDAIHGRGAFRKFKNLISRVGLIDSWYKYRDNAFKQEAIAWCEVNDVELTHDE